MSYFVAVKNKEGEYKHFKVPPEVALYIRQLECYVLCPDISKLKTVYADKFGEQT